MSPSARCARRASRGQDPQASQAGRRLQARQLRDDRALLVSAPHQLDGPSGKTASGPDRLGRRVLASSIRFPPSLVDTPGRLRSRMRLNQVTVTDYRCINDSGPVEVGDVTCLVGKNESGKTAFLQSLRKLNPVEGPSPYDDVMDYPAKGFARYKKIRAEQPAEVVTAVFELSDEEAAAIERDLGEGVLRGRIFTVTKHYPPGGTTFGVQVNEAAAVRHLTKDLVLPEGQGKTIRQLKTIAKLAAALDAIETPHATVTELREQIASWRKGRLTLKLIDDYLDKWLPRFFYFDSYSILSGKVSIPELRRRRDAGE